MSNDVCEELKWLKWFGFYWLGDEPEEDFED
jgi:hypothetical protein